MRMISKHVCAISSSIKVAKGELANENVLLIPRTKVDYRVVSILIPETMNILFFVSFF